MGPPAICTLLRKATARLFMRSWSLGRWAYPSSLSAVSHLCTIAASIAERHSISPSLIPPETFFTLQRGACICQNLLPARYPPDPSESGWYVCSMRSFAPNHSSSPDPSAQSPIKLLTSHRHLQGIERILHDIVGVELINLRDNRITVRLVRFGEEQEFHAGRCLKARQAEIRSLEHFEAGEE